MSGLVMMLGRVLIRGAVTAKDFATGKAYPQMDPSISRFHTFFADQILGQLWNFDVL